MPETLKPCPFCGDVFAPIAIKTRATAWWVRCEQERGGCGAEGPAAFSTRREAVRQWNTRNDPLPRRRAI